MRLFDVKSVAGGVIDIDDKSRRVVVAMNEVDTKDLDGDVIDRNAFNKTVRERGPQGSDLIWHLTDHYGSLKSAVGKPSEIKIGNKLVFVTTIMSTTWGNDVLEMYKANVINQHSIGFRTIKSEPVNAGTPEEYRLIKEVLLYEGSAVTWAANPNTPTLSVGKSLTKEESQDAFTELVKEINNLHKLLKNGSVTDETFELLELQLIQKTERLQQLFDLHTQPADKAVEPSKDEDLLDVLKTFNNSLTLQNESRRIKDAALRA